MATASSAIAKVDTIALELDAFSKSE